MYQTFLGHIKSYEVSFYLVVWFLVNLATAASTEIYSDEAYYWVFSRFLDWGYLDHPPMIAALIKLGTLLGSTEVGVRIVSIFMGTATIWLIYKLCQPVKAKFFFATVFSMLSLNLIGFLSVPDVPLLFFTATYFYFYRNYLNEPSVWSALKLGLVIAALFYSKYHGVLLIVFTLLSNPKLFRQRTFYLVAATAILFLLPHILWQVQHDYPSIQYHLVDRGTSDYRINKTVEYLLANIPFHGPWASLVLIFASLKYRTKDLWEKSLKWNLIGIFIFFLFMTSKGSVEANWTLIMVVPFLVLGLRKLMEWKRFQLVYLRVTYIFVALIVMVRLLLIFPLDSLPIKRVLEFHGGEHYVKTVYKHAAGLPVVANSYQDASMLSFYAPDQDHIVPSLNIDSRSNQYDFWDLDLPLCGEAVLYVNNHLVGEKIPGRKRSEKTLNVIQHLPPVSGVDLEIIKIETESSLISIEIQILLAEIDCHVEALEDISIRVDFWKDDLWISTEYQGLDEILEWDSDGVVIPIELTFDSSDNNPNNISLSFYYNDLGGSPGIVARRDL